MVQAEHSCTRFSVSDQGEEHHAQEKQQAQAITNGIAGKVQRLDAMEAPSKLTDVHVQGFEEQDEVEEEEFEEEEEKEKETEKPGQEPEQVPEEESERDRIHISVQSESDRIRICVQSVDGTVLWGPAAVSPDICVGDLREVAAEGWPSSTISFLNGQCLLDPCVTLAQAGAQDGTVLTLVKSCKPEVIVNIPVRPPETRLMKTPQVADWFLPGGGHLPCTLVASEGEWDLDEDEEHASMVVKICPGDYQITHDITVSCAPSSESDDVQDLRKGETIYVVTVLVLPEEELVRGKIEKPVQGWISLCGLIFGRAWVKPLPAFPASATD